MKDFTILQVGDLHYDDLRNAELDVDVKDRVLSDSIRESLGPHVLQAVMKPMVEQLELSDAVMITGDLSSYGNYAVYVRRSRTSTSPLRCQTEAPTRCTRWSES